jgi:hypothetical protein
MKARLGYAKHWTVFCLLSALLITGCASASPEVMRTSGVQLEQGTDILQEEILDFRNSIDETVAYFHEAGVQLNKPVTIVLTRNRKDFLAEAAKRFGISEIEVNRVGKGVDALSGNSLIVINVDGTPTPRQRTFLLAHELTHQYQRQLAGAKAGEVKWLLEGAAEAVGAQVVARRGYLSIEQYKANWQAGIRMAEKKPALAQLRTSQEWSDSLSAYGSGLTYKTAGLGCLILFEQYGVQRVLQYYKELGTGRNSDEAFRNSFEVDMLQFERRIEMLVRKVS